MADIMFHDLIKDDKTQVFYVSKPMKNQSLNFIRGVHTSIKLTKYFEPPFKTVWYLNDIIKMIDDDTVLLLQIDSMIHMGIRLLEYIRAKRPLVKLVLILVDSVHAHSWTMKYAKKYIFNFNWDLILSYDNHDCKEYGFTYLGLSYYSKIDDIAASNKKSDIYYIGSVKNEDSRKKVLERINSGCQMNHINTNFTLIGYKKSELDESNIKTCENNISYRQVLSELMSSNCILEIVQPGQMKQTVRYFEAVCYNKKLLTNNRYIIQLPYYDPRYMQVFDDEDKIDFEWIRDYSTNDYHYQGEFTPKEIYNLIENVIYHRGIIQ